LVTLEGLRLTGNFPVKLGELHEKHAVQRGFGLPTLHVLQERGNTRKIFSDLPGRSTFRIHTDFFTASCFILKNAKVCFTNIFGLREGN
jgi:hypothetical protein